MAYSFTVSTVQIGRLDFQVTIVELEVADGNDEFSFDAGKAGTVYLQKSVLVPGDGSAVSVDPTLFEAAGGGANDKVTENGSAGGSIRNDIGAHYSSTTGLLYGRSGADDAIGTGTITTTYLISKELRS